ncbi:uncharacterized protein BDZ99DRAFT_516785 [Mytilinidion resinicola]|uniref:Uncharacterized protein n=1 Tax=Mytilinidion resinicola TaxID=574789 RepID=A0A6A6Z1W2_9PEZI|nr:uncharacterized protein BDZ99DRAFT_516785 [Mytilinidion resinicola]KAF2814175.1 hypothetical protein BDZ99DRAFT_516785 [Mytilinidion resinicola]
MKFTTIIAAVLSLATFAVAAPVPATDDVAARQNHGMCVTSDGTTVTQIEGC